MEIISYLEGSVIVTCTWDEIRPIAGAPHSVVLEFLRNRYSFQNVGTSAAALQLQLTTPSLSLGNLEGISIQHLDFQGNVVMVASTTTDNALTIFADVMASLKDAFGFRIPPLDRQKTFKSTIISDLGFNISETLKPWVEVQNLINKLRGNPDIFEIELFSIRMMARKDEYYNANDQFIMEPRLPSPPGTQWMFSNAPLTTKDHEKVLHLISKQFGSKGK